MTPTPKLKHYAHVIGDKSGQVRLPNAFPKVVTMYEQNLHIPLTGRPGWEWGDTWEKYDPKILLDLLPIWANDWGHIPVGYTGPIQIDIEAIELESEAAANVWVPALDLIRKLRPGVQVGFYAASTAGYFVKLNPKIAAACDVAFPSYYPMKIITDETPKFSWQGTESDYMKVLSAELLDPMRTAWGDKPMILVAGFRWFNLGRTPTNWAEIQTQWKLAASKCQGILWWDDQDTDQDADQASQIYSRIYEEAKIQGEMV